MAINILPTRRNLRFKLNPSKALTWHQDGRNVIDPSGKSKALCEAIELQYCFVGGGGYVTSRFR